MSKHRYIPSAIFGTLDAIIEQSAEISSAENPRHTARQWLNACFAECSAALPVYASQDYLLAMQFLISYRGSLDTFTAYRREIERLLQWSWFVQEQSVLKHRRGDIEAFVRFCIKPYKRWIGLKNAPRFRLIKGHERPNPEWRPFTVNVAKKDRLEGILPDKSDFKLSPSTLKAMFGILSSFYQFLLQDEIVSANPVTLIKQKSKFVRKESTAPVIRRLSNEQWQMVIDLAKAKAHDDVSGERTVFILSCLYSMFLRISELVASERWIPTMGDFYQDSDDFWWFKTVSKGNKARQIAVSDAMLASLAHYRTQYLHLYPYPELGEKTPLVGHITNSSRPITSTRPLRRLVQACFDDAANELNAQNNLRQAESLRTATVHWLRHTGISEDVKTRPREHVRDDAGHSSSAITDRYIDVELKARAQSAKDKPIENCEEKS